MFDAGLTPGPRAFHVLVFAYVRGKKPKDALGVAQRASDEGVGMHSSLFVGGILALFTFLKLYPVSCPMHIFCRPGFQLLPETYVVLIYAFLNLEAQDGVESAGPDLETAYSLLESMKVSKDMTTTPWLACMGIAKRVKPSVVDSSFIRGP